MKLDERDLGIEDVRKSLEFIQGIINRMNSNSFQLKGLLITIVSALFAIYASNSNILFLFLSLFPTIFFWFLDSYYLMKERQFRELYNSLINKINSSSNEELEIRLYDLSIEKFKDGNCTYRSSFLSKTISALYLSVVVFILSIIALVYTYNILGEVAHVCCCNCK